MSVVTFWLSSSCNSCEWYEEVISLLCRRLKCQAHVISFGVVRAAAIIIVSCGFGNFARAIIIIMSRNALGRNFVSCKNCLQIRF